ncbi:MAG: DUF6876 family protein [Candidatus Micrarchaeota archaeon]
MDAEKTKFPSELKAELAQFCGTEQYHRYLNGCVLTDGAKYLAEKAKAFWLMDIVASYQPREEEFQIWRLTVNDDRSAVVEMFEDVDESDKPVKLLVRQEIKFTDFPMKEIKLYCQEGGAGRVIFLPSEY